MNREGSINSEDFNDWMRPALRDYYNARIDLLRDAIACTLPEEFDKDLLHTALGRNDHEHLRETLGDAVYHPMRQYIRQKGKLFRPLITCLFLEAYGADMKAFKPAIAISEIIHSSSLVLDDIADSSLLRRGEPCAHRLYGIPRAANASSAMTFFVFNLIRHHLHFLDETAKTRLFETLLWEHYITSIGSALDLGWVKLRKMEIPEGQYIQHILFRSCSYTYRHAAKIGAIAANAPEEELKLIHEFSSLVGIAFQYMDDILNLKPGSATWGKTVGEDITEGKRSPLVLHAIRHTGPGDRHRLLAILDGHVTDPEVIAEGISILERSGAFEATREKASLHIEKACKIIDRARVLPEHLILMKEIAHYTIERKK